MKEKSIMTAESVTEGHPDKLCDTIADAVLDECLRIDKNARVACEVMATEGKVIVAGEITVKEMPDIPYIVCRTIKHVGYDCDYEVEVITHDQSSDIAGAVEGCSDRGALGISAMYIDDVTGQICEKSCLGNEAFPDSNDTLGAGDQGIMYGYAGCETDEMLPLPVVLAHRITRLLTVARRSGLIKGILPDGKAQVSVEYEYDTPMRISAIVVSCQHRENKNLNELRNEIVRYVLEPAFSIFPFDSDTDIFINPSGKFVKGGFEADTGLTGRKLMVDTYGGLVPHGGGALSGKDATKVDRSGAYMARYIAKNVVAAGLAERCTVGFAYAIGKAEPVAVDIDTHDTGDYADDIIRDAVIGAFDLTPAGIIKALKLDAPIFGKTSNYGHFTDQSLPWEQTDKTDELLELCVALEEYDEERGV